MVNDRPLLVSKTETTVLLSISVEPMYAMQQKHKQQGNEKNREETNDREGGIDTKQKRVAVTGGYMENGGGKRRWFDLVLSFTFWTAYLVHHCLGVFFSSAFCIPNIICALSYGPLSSFLFCLTVLFLSPDPKSPTAMCDPGLGTRRRKRERGLDRSSFFFGGCSWTLFPALRWHFALPFTRLCSPLLLCHLPCPALSAPVHA